MSFWTAVVGIVAILSLTAMRIARYRARPDDPAARSGHPHTPHLAAKRDTELQREVEDLRDRVKVLERIVTDERGSRAISAEIESLRDR